MATEKETERLAHAIWEKEGCPEDRAEEHWYRAKKFLENQEVAEAAGVPSLASLSKESEYHFNFSFAVAMIAIGMALVFLSPPVIISGLNSVVIGGILSILSFAIIIKARANLEPSEFYVGRIMWGISVIVASVVIIIVAALSNYYRPGTLPTWIQWIGPIAFVVGFYIAIFSRRRKVASRR